MWSDLLENDYDKDNDKDNDNYIDIDIDNDTDNDSHMIIISRITTVFSSTVKV